MILIAVSWRSHGEEVAGVFHGISREARPAHEAQGHRSPHRAVSACRARTECAPALSQKPWLSISIRSFCRRPRWWKHRRIVSIIEVKEMPRPYRDAEPSSHCLWPEIRCYLIVITCEQLIPLHTPLTHSVSVAWLYSNCISIDCTDIIEYISFSVL